MKNEQEIEKINLPIRAVIKTEQPRRFNKNLKNFWMEHQQDYLDYDEFFPE